jgi:hypothetical protein
LNIGLEGRFNLVQGLGATIGFEKVNVGHITSDLKSEFTTIETFGVREQLNIEKKKD